MISISAVSATDNQTDYASQDDADLNLATAKVDSLSDNQKSYTDLYQDIAESGDIFNMESDYKCGDNESSELINKTNLTINGNGHAIDGSNKSSGLLFNTTLSDKTITINDLH